MRTVEADYLVVGGGAMGMAFTDTLLAETDATVVMVDRNHQPGGHWNVAYPFVRLHQPSSFYGVNSRALGSDSIDAVGWNQGLYELATGNEVCAYFDAVMQQQFLPSGRVQYFPMCEYTGDGRFHSKVADLQFQARTAKVVDATYMNVNVPSMQPPPFEVEDGSCCVPPNALAELAAQYRRYVIVGAGKTGMDACLFLLRNGVEPERIRWVMPRDSWMFNRALIQSNALFERSIARGQAMQLQALAEATSLEDALERVAATGFILRFNPQVWPTMWRCATVTPAELEQLRRIENVIRLGRVQRIGTETITLDQGEVPTGADTLHVNCTADGLARRPAVPVFDGARITLQAVRTCQQVFSAAFIAHVESAYDDEATRNALCAPVPHPDDNVDFLRTSLADIAKAGRWGQDPALQRWLIEARLDGFSHPGMASGSEAQQADMLAMAIAAADNVERILATVDANSAPPVPSSS